MVCKQTDTTLQFTSWYPMYVIGKSTIILIVKADDANKRKCAEYDLWSYSCNATVKMISFYSFQLHSNSMEVYWISSEFPLNVQLPWKGLDVFIKLLYSRKKNI